MGCVALKSWAAGLELRGGVRASSRADSESAASTGGAIPQPPWASTGSVRKKLARNYASVYTVFWSDLVWGGFYLA